MIEFILVSTQAPVITGRTAQIPLVQTRSTPNGASVELTDRQSFCFKQAVTLIESAQKIVASHEKRLERAIVQLTVVRREDVTEFKFIERQFKIARMDPLRHRASEVADWFKGLSFRGVTSPRRQYKDLEARSFSEKEGKSYVHVYLFNPFEGPAFSGSEGCMVYSPETLALDLASKDGIQKRTFSMKTYYPTGVVEQSRD